MIFKNKKSWILRISLKEAIKNSCYNTDEEYSENNIPNYTLFNNECETLEFSYSVVASKWKNAHNIPSLDDYLKWRKNFSKRNLKI